MSGDALEFLTVQKMKFSIKDFLGKCDQIRRKLLIWSHLLNKSSMENFIFCAGSFQVDFKKVEKTLSYYPKLCENWESPQNFRTSKLDKIRVIYAVLHAEAVQY